MAQAQRLTQQTNSNYRRDNMDRVNADTDRLINNVERMLIQRRLKNKGAQ